MTNKPHSTTMSNSTTPPVSLKWGRPGTNPDVWKEWHVHRRYTSLLTYSQPVANTYMYMYMQLTVIIGGGTGGGGHCTEGTCLHKVLCRGSVPPKNLTVAFVKARGPRA